MSKTANKNLMFGLALVLGMFICLSMASAATGTVTLLKPLTSATISGTAVLNVTNVTFNKMVNCTFYVKSASTANSTWTTVATEANNTLYNVNATFNSAGFEDASDYMINATCRNSTNDIAAAVNTLITIDNSKPTAPSALSPGSLGTSITTDTTQTFSATVTDRETTGCTYTMGKGGATSGNDYITGTGTYSASSCSFTKDFNSTVDNGDWYWAIIATDGTNTTSSGQNILRVQFPGDGGGIGGGTLCLGLGASCGDLGCCSGLACQSGVCKTVQTGTGEDNSFKTGLIIVVILIGLVWFITKK